ncbi:hypothetical protein [Adhaeribacter terreus]|uniref:Uncharacterized protein n=1 Tax=Adhaeribacter terreus TaxID=529703 RepID=A0ABW0EGI7_9BACT
MRNLFLLLFIFLLSSAAAAAQENTAPTQAKIWHRALVWIYEDNNKTLGKNEQKPVPQVSNESLANFEKDLAAASKANKDGYNFYKLVYQPVQEKLAKSKPVSDEALMNAIVAETSKKPGRNVKHLRFALETATKSEAVSETPEEYRETTAMQPEPEPENVTAPTVPSNTEKPVKDENKLPMYLSILALLLAAFALWRASQKNTSRAAVVRSENDMLVAGKSASESPNVKALKRQIQTMRNEYHQLKSENENWRADMQQAIQNLQAAAFINPLAKENYADFHDQSTSQNLGGTGHQHTMENYSETPAEAQPYEVETDHLFAEEPQPQSHKKYTRVPEDGLLKDREMHTDSRETWSFIEVTIPDAQSNTATFRINPYVNHALAINNSLDRLENAFEFARSANKATQLINDADGELMRTAQGWQITKRARIHLA